MKIKTIFLRIPSFKLYGWITWIILLAMFVALVVLGWVVRGCKPMDDGM